MNDVERLIYFVFLAISAANILFYIVTATLLLVAWVIDKILERKHKL